MHLPARLTAPLLALVLAGCSAGTDVDPDVAVPAQPSTAASNVGPDPSPRATAQLIEATYRDGEVTGVDSRVAVPLGTDVVLRFTSDVTEEIHVHGYDLFTDLVPGQPAEIAFTADKPGVYEVELHDAGRPMYQLRVS